MAKILVIYYSKSGNTEKMAKAVVKGVQNYGAVDVELKNVENTTLNDLLEADGLIIGAPNYWSTVPSPVKKLFDESIKIWGKLEGRVGAAFTSTGNIGGGGVTAILSILEFLLTHGMIVQGSKEGGHFGPVSIGAPDERVLKECENLGQRVAHLVKRLKPE